MYQQPGMLFNYSTVHCRPKKLKIDIILGRENLKIILYFGKKSSHKKVLCNDVTLLSALANVGLEALWEEADQLVHLGQTVRSVHLGRTARRAFSTVFAVYGIAFLTVGADYIVSVE